MNGKFLLDTNIVIAIFANEVAVLQHIAQAEEVYIPVVVIGELYYGAFNSGQAAKNLKKIDEFTLSINKLDTNLATAKQYGIIKKQLKEKGKPIPENDIWIAAIAMQYQLTLVSRDNHLSYIDGLSLIMW